MPSVADLRRMAIEDNDREALRMRHLARLCYLRGDKAAAEALERQALVRDAMSEDLRRTVTDFTCVYG